MGIYKGVTLEKARRAKGEQKMANFNYIKALMADPENHAVQKWVQFPVDEEEQEKEILAFFNNEEENTPDAPLRRFYCVDDELPDAEIDELLKEPKFYELDELDIIEVAVDTDDTELDEAVEEAVEDGLNASELNKICEIIEDWDDDEQALFCAVHWNEGRWFSITDYDPRNYNFYPDKNKQEVAEEWLFDDYYPDFPDELRDYLDLEKWSEWEMDNYTETDWGTYCEC